MFIFITILVVSKDAYFYDDIFYKLLMNIKSNSMTSYFKFITKFGNINTIIFISLLSLITLFKNKDYPYYLITAAISVTIINLTIKHIFKRLRPSLINLITETGYSYPSGHAMISVSFYGLIIYLILKSELNKKIKIISSTLLILLIINICLSRIYLGVHYLSDVLGGIFLSYIILITIITIMKKYKGEKYEKSTSNRSK